MSAIFEGTLPAGDANLALMGNQSEARGETAAVALLPAAAVKAIGDERKPLLPAPEMRPRPAQSSGE